MRIDYDERVIRLEKPPRVTKKFTGTWFAAALGLNPWSTEFETWCDRTNTYKKPFEDTKYTLAGKAIEPIIIKWLDASYYYGRGIVKTPQQWFHKTTQQMGFDHFPDSPVFGGMWDARTDSKVYEIKTTKRGEDWIKNGKPDAPEYYKLQAALYARLMGLDAFTIVVAFLEESDYDNPTAFIPRAANSQTRGNIQTFSYSLAKEYPRFDGMLDEALDWWNRHVLLGVSPPWNPSKTKDKEILKALTTSTIGADARGSESAADGGDQIQALMKELEAIETRFDAMSADEKRRKECKDLLKELLQARMSPTDKKCVVTGEVYDAVLSLSESSGIDRARLKADGLLEKYQTLTPSTKLTFSRRK
jgi:hypothetical protein